ncbi:MAG: hypothetical protein ACM3ZC_06115 [Bacteroidota bacterium]
MAYEFRARGVGELIDATFRIYRAYWWPLMQSVGIILLPVGILQAGLQALVQLAQERIQADPSMWFFLIAVALIARLPALLFALAGTFVGAPVVHQTAQACFGADPGAGPAWRAVRSRFGRVLGAAGISTVLLAMAGAFACCSCGLGGLVLGVFLSVFMPIIMLETAGIGQSLQRSFKLVGARFWQVVWTQVVIYLIILIPALLLGGAVLLLAVGDWRAFGEQLQSGGAFTSLLYFYIYLGVAVYSTLAGPIYSVSSTLIYFDLRVRLEGYDLDRAVTGAGLTTGGRVGDPVS